MSSGLLLFTQTNIVITWEFVTGFFSYTHEIHKQIILSLTIKYFVTKIIPLNCCYANYTGAFFFFESYKMFFRSSKVPRMKSNHLLIVNIVLVLFFLLLSTRMCRQKNRLTTTHRRHIVCICCTRVAAQNKTDLLAACVHNKPVVL